MLRIITVLFGISTRTGLHALMLRNTSGSSSCLKHSVSAPVSLRPPPPEHRSLLWLVSSHPSSPFISAELAARHKLCKCRTWWCSVMSQSHYFKVRLLTRRFRWQKKTTDNLILTIILLIFIFFLIWILSLLLHDSELIISEVRGFTVQFLKPTEEMWLGFRPI